MLLLVNTNSWIIWDLGKKLLQRDKGTESLMLYITHHPYLGIAGTWNEWVDEIELEKPQIRWIRHSQKAEFKKKYSLLFEPDPGIYLKIFKSYTYKTWRGCSNQQNMVDDRKESTAIKSQQNQQQQYKS